MARTTNITFGQVAAIADAMKAAGTRPTARAVRDTAALRHDFKPAVLGWRHLVALIDLVAVALFALAIRGIVRDVKLYKAAKVAKVENKNA